MILSMGPVCLQSTLSLPWELTLPTCPWGEGSSHPKQLLGPQQEVELPQWLFFLAAAGGLKPRQEGKVPRQTVSGQWRHWPHFISGFFLPPPISHLPHCDLSRSFQQLSSGPALIGQMHVISGQCMMYYLPLATG